MTFAGWSLGQAALFFAVTGSAVTALYLLRMRRRRVQVPFADLWEQAVRTSDARRLANRLRRLWSWLLQLVLLALLALAVTDPRPSAWVRPPRTRILVIDASPSMAAASDGGPPRLDVALDRARSEISALGPADRAAVVAAGTGVDVLVPLGPSAAARAASLAVAPMAGDSAFSEALDLARALAVESPDPSILVLTDGALAPSAARALAACTGGEVPCRVARIPGPSANVGIAAFSARRHPLAPDRVEILVRLENHDDVPHEVVVDVRAGEVAAARLSATVPPHAESRHVLADVDAADPRLTARIRDAAGGVLPGTPVDDVAHAVVPRKRPTHVRVRTDGTNLYLEAALLSLGEAVRTTVVNVPDAPGGPAEDDASETADLAIVDVGSRPLPPLPEAPMVVVFDPWRHADAAFPIARLRDVRAPLLTEQDRTHPLLADVSFTDVNIARGTVFRIEPGDEVLAAAAGDPIVVRRRRDGRSLVAVGFDPRQSDLPLRVAYPLFLANLVDEAAQRTAGFVAAVDAGAATLVRVADLGLSADDGTEVTVVPPQAAPYPVSVVDGRIRVLARAPGFVRLDAPGSDPAYLAVRIPPVGPLSDRLDGTVDAAAEAGPAPSPFPVADDPLFRLLLLLAVAIAAVEWWTYHRRWTV